MYICRCCGYMSLELEPPGTFTICDVCDWGDDSVQFSDPDYEGDANIYSLRQSQYRYVNGYSAKHNNPLFEKDPNWVILSEQSDKKSHTDYYVDSDGNTGST
ncbi:CPCC family cysteine-rich protein [uncultured Microbulbifer sp.]|uniref:CPCC family cysteine-rich protein n=1 Tax=uncultured Microbulbifer sp. TaxID=348147 RepID=UPI002607DB31|nr:CPCC family cysteine-rich protein [uncultured Microbulbifer sp.]